MHLKQIVKFLTKVNNALKRRQKACGENSHRSQTEAHRSVAAHFSAVRS